MHTYERDKGSPLSRSREREAAVRSVAAAFSCACVDEGSKGVFLILSASASRSNEPSRSEFAC